MNESDAQTLLLNMVQIPSPSGAEQVLASYLANTMEQLGFQSSIDAVGNVIGRRGPPDRPMILLLGHLDTAADQIPVYRAGSTLYGRGAVDAKGPLATCICAAAQVDPRDAQIVVVGAVEEETPGSRGARHLLEHYRPEMVIIGEPSGWAHVGIGYKGRIGMQYRVHRPRTHTASPDEKATEVAVAFWNDLTRYLATTSLDSSLFYRPTATLEQFSGDIEQACLDLSCRIPPGFDIQEFELYLERIRHDGHLHIDERTPAVLIDRAAPTVAALLCSIRQHGGSPKLKIKTGTTDMNVVGTRWHVPMAAYGPGDGRLDHTSSRAPRSQRLCCRDQCATRRIGAADPAGPAVPAGRCLHARGRSRGR